jgi:hydrophobe/amphiphile efflux-3 (HAE3) family protein
LITSLLTWPLRWPRLVVAVFVVWTVGFAFLLPRVQIDPEIKNQLPPDMPARQDTARIEEVFGGTERVLLIVEAPDGDVLDPQVLEKIRALSDGLATVPGVERVMSPFTVPALLNTPDGLDSSPAVTDIPSDQAGRDALRTRLASSTLVSGTVIASDFSAAAVVGMLRPGAVDAETVGGVRDLIASAPGAGTVSIGGMPSVRVQVSEDIRADLRRFVPVGLVTLLLFQWLCFRTIRGVVIPVAIVVSTEITTLALLPVLDWKMQIMMVTMPVMLLAVGNAYSLHLLAYHQESVPRDGSGDARTLAHKVITDLGTPLLADGLTTVAGFLALVTHIVVPAQRLGLLTSFGVTYAMFASLWVVPAVLSLLEVPPPLPPPSETAKQPLLERLLAQMATGVVRFPKTVVAVTIAIVLVVVAGLPNLTIDTNPVNYYDAGAPVRRTAAIIDEHFGGSTEVLVLVPGDVKDPAVLARVDALEQKIGAFDHVGSVTSVAGLLRQIRSAMTAPGDPPTSPLPDRRDAIAQDLATLEMGNAAAVESVVDFGYTHALLTARISSLSTGDVAEVVREIKAETADDSGVVVGGFGVIFSDLVSAIIQGQNSSLVLSLVTVFVMCVVSFRSIEAGSYSMVPLLVGIPVLYGLMGHLGIELNVVTAMLSSILVGIGVDYTIHFLWRVRAARAEGLDTPEAVHHSLVTAGRAILFNALSTSAGFGVLLLSSFLPVRFFGFLVLTSLGACCAAALLLLPALCVWLKPRFLDPPVKA